MGAPALRFRGDSAIYVIALTGFTWGLSDLPSLLGAAVLAGGILTLALFVWWESRCADPLLDLWLFRHNRVFALSNLASFINYSATFAVGFLVSLYLQYIKGYSAESAGLVLVAQPALQALVSPWAAASRIGWSPGWWRQQAWQWGRSASACWSFWAGAPALFFWFPCWRCWDWVLLCFLPQHQHHHVKCRASALWVGFGHVGHHAYGRPDVQHGGGYAGVRPRHWAGADYTRPLRRLPPGNPLGLHHLRGSVCGGHVRFIGEGHLRS